MSNEHDSQILLQVAELAHYRPEWRAYAEYCQLREYGLRKKALLQLREFIEQITTWALPERIAFVHWVCEQTFLYGTQGENPYPLGHYGSQSLMPYPLMEEVVRPTLHEWTLEAPQEVLPHRWLGIFFSDETDHLTEALWLNPYDQPSRIADIRLCLRILDFSTHELPKGYIGDAASDLLLANETFESIAYVTNTAVQQWSYHKARYYEALIQDWVDFRSTEETDFHAWCEQRGRQYDWVSSYAYAPKTDAIDEHNGE